MKNIALIMAAGNSTRCGFDKLVAELGNMTVLDRCLHTFETCDAIDEIWIIGSDRKFKVDLENTKIQGFIAGGDSRFKSIKSGLEHCQKHYKQEKDVRIVVHNAANPHLFKVDLERGLEKAEKKQNIIFGFFSPNSIKQVLDNGLVSNFLDREQIFETQTPQISTLNTFTKALEAWDKIPGSTDTLKKDPGINSPEPRDEAELLKLINEDIYVYECDPSNTKITFASDLVPHQPCGQLPLTQGERIGIGEDSHRFAPNFDPQKPFRLGGIDMSEGRLSSDGNSDGDLILHSLCNALLSAHGDKTFDPIAAPICAAGNTNSSSYLKATLEHLEEKYKTQNLKSKISQVLISLEGAQPRLAPQHDAIVHNLAKLLDIKPQQIGLTYTTGEGLSDYGKGLGMHAYVLVTLAS